ncbi:glutathione S-transferase family protein [Aurantimonas sp. Leaf443]|uniref:glutathione S-transferase family protein n=1 Tax=Aurantimonas sp. Leaf443 TaxID=1736378 RepID=UPI0006FE4D0D|nr:glutathione S-transferase family protein [Aurantimonas sp. Leaf443]KQT83110.1 glutathione S-transferase [Aurantimonas sp. Leaf443]
MRLTIANKNYSSWSLRPWVLMKALAIPFEERILYFGPQTKDAFRAASPTARVPVLETDGLTVWDSLAIVETLAETHPGVWPSNRAARAFARSACAEMHAGFPVLRDICTMSCGVRVALSDMPPALQADIGRVGAIFEEGLTRFGGPFLAGEAFTAADAFFCPVAFRVRTYGLLLPEPAAAYVERLLALPAMVEWHAAALSETEREPGHEADMHRAGRVLSDARAAASL